jgi:hypothetical protein
MFEFQFCQFGTHTVFIYRLSFAGYSGKQKTHGSFGNRGFLGNSSLVAEIYVSSPTLPPQRKAECQHAIRREVPCITQQVLFLIVGFIS